MKKILLALGIIALLAMASCSKDGATATMTVINDSSFIINEFYCTLSTNPDWGSNLLSGTIPSGSSQVFTIIAGTVDLDAEETTGLNYWDAYDQVVAADGVYEWTLTDGIATAY